MTDASKLADDDHARGCEGRCYTCTCGYDDRVDAALHERDTLAAEVERLKAEADPEMLTIAWMHGAHDAKHLAAENARLRKEVEAYAKTMTAIGETANAEAALIVDLRAHAAELAGALDWYAEQTAGCRKVTSEGNEARHQLDSDGGKRARTALAKHREMK